MTALEPTHWEYIWVEEERQEAPGEEAAWKPYKPFSLPDNPHNDAYIWLKTKIPPHSDKTMPALYIRYINNIETIVIGSQIIFNRLESGKLRDSYLFFEPNQEEMDLLIKIYRSESHLYFIQELWVGAYKRVIAKRILKDADRFILGLLFIIVGIATIMLIRKVGEPKMMSAFSTFTISSGLYVFLDTPTVHLFLPSTEKSIDFLIIAGLCLIPVSLNKYLYETFRNYHPSWFRFTYYLFMLFAATIIFLTIVQTMYMHSIVKILQLYLLTATLVGVIQTWLIMRHAFSGNRKVKSFSIGLTLLTLAIINDTMIVLQLADYFLLLLHWGIFFFILFLLQILKTIWIEKSEEIKNYSKNLEHMVVDRTRKLESAQKQMVVQEKMAALGNMTAGIAHELKNPLNFINNFSSLSVDLISEWREALREKKPPEEVDEIVETIEHNIVKIEEHGKRANNIINSMLLHSRGGSGKRQAVDINKFLKEALHLAYHSMRASYSGFNIEMEENYGDIPLFMAIPEDISRVFINILNNAMYATYIKEQGGEPPKIKVSTRQNKNNEIEICIRDNGTGLTKEVKEKLFEPFFTTKPTGKGTGLGLSISYDIIVKEHQGKVDVKTELGKFTEFVITFTGESE